jgi:hypothetical protein
MVSVPWMNCKIIFDNKISIQMCGHCVDIGSMADIQQSLLCPSSRFNHYPVCCADPLCVPRVAGTTSFDLLSDGTVKSFFWTLRYEKSFNMQV